MILFTLDSKLPLKQFLTAGEFRDLYAGTEYLADELQVFTVHVMPQCRSHLSC